MIIKVIFYLLECCFGMYDIMGWIFSIIWVLWYRFGILELERWKLEDYKFKVNFRYIMS